MDSSPVVGFTNPSPTRVPPRRSWSMSRAVLVLLCVSMFAPPGGSFASTPLVKSCNHASLRQIYAPRGFGGYACRDDRCTLHKAGFDWAERNGIADPAACTPPREPAFVEGCRAYAEDAVTAEQAGFEWARENEIGDTCDCTGAGLRFDAGCAAYVAGFAQ
jgi:hypothetical protein